MKTTKKKLNPQEGCVSFEAALTRLRILDQPSMRVKFFKFMVVSPEGNKLTLTFDPAKLKKEQAVKPTKLQ